MPLPPGRCQGYKEKGVEPDYVEVEPVLGCQLDADQESRAEGRYLCERLFARTKREEQRERGDRREDRVAKGF